MITGMLWFDNNPKNTLTGKITEAAEYYRKKIRNLPRSVPRQPRHFSGRRIPCRPHPGSSSALGFTRSPVDWR